MFRPRPLLARHRCRCLGSPREHPIRLEVRVGSNGTTARPFRRSGQVLVLVDPLRRHAPMGAKSSARNVASEKLNCGSSITVRPSFDRTCIHPESGDRPAAGDPLPTAARSSGSVFRCMTDGLMTLDPVVPMNLVRV